MNKRRKAVKIYLTAALMICTAFLFMLPVSASTPASAEILVSKHLYGDVPSDKAIFHIVLTAQNDTTPMPDGQTGGTKVINIEEPNENGFGPISYTREGIFQYTVHEQDDGVSGYVYDQNVFNVTVYVSADDADQLSAKVIITEKGIGVKTDEIIFWNGYEKISDSEMDVLQISKQVNGDAPENDTFQIQIFLGTDTTRTYVYSDTEGNKQGILKYGDYINIKAGQIIQIENVIKGTSYKIVETQKAYYTPTPLTGIITGVVETGINTAVFTNTYDKSTPAPVSIDPPVQKQVAGEGAPSDTIFRFTFEGFDDQTPMPEGSEGRTKVLQIVGAGDAEAGYITYTKAGIYTYTFSEINDKAAGYTYDTEVYTMTVTVTDEDGKLQAARGFRNSSERDVNQIVFLNHFANVTGVDSTPAEPYPTEAGDDPTIVPDGGTVTPVPGTIAEDTDGTTPQSTATITNVISRIIHAVKTADPTQLAGYLTIAVAAAVMIILAVKKRKNREDE